MWDWALYNYMKYPRDLISFWNSSSTEDWVAWLSSGAHFIVFSQAKMNVLSMLMACLYIG